MARPEIPDTSVLIGLAHANGNLDRLYHRLTEDRLWMSSVVLSEFLAGTRSPEEAHLVERLVAIFSRTGRLLTPAAAEWTLAGRLIARRIRLTGSERPRDHFNDLLIILSAARASGTVITANVRHFNAWATHTRRAGLDVQVLPDSAL